MAKVKSSRSEFPFQRWRIEGTGGLSMDLKRGGLELGSRSRVIERSCLCVL